MHAKEEVNEMRKIHKQTPEPNKKSQLGSTEKAEGETLICRPES